MRRVNIRQLQHNLREIISWINRGEEVFVLKRGHTIAKIVPLSKLPGERVDFPDFANRARKVLKRPRGIPLSAVVIEARRGRI